MLAVSMLRLEALISEALIKLVLICVDSMRLVFRLEMLALKALSWETSRKEVEKVLVIISLALISSTLRVEMDAWMACRVETSIFSVWMRSAEIKLTEI